MLEEEEPEPSGGGLVRSVYATALRLGTPLYLARLLQRSLKEPGYRAHLGERFGFYRGPRREAAPIWIHAVSLGETRAAMPLIEALRRQSPSVELLLTHGTATGREAGSRLVRECDQQAWLPFDTPGAVRRFLRRFRPTVGVLMETEIWPVLLHEARQAGVPMVLANARLSERSALRGRRLAALLHPAVRSLQLVLAQTLDDANRLRDAGARRVVVAGNLKFDMTPQPRQLAKGLSWRQRMDRPVVMMASSREGEEAMLLDLWQRLPEPRPLLLIVPRHPQRFDDVAALVKDRGLRLVRRSDWDEQAPPVDFSDCDVWLGDSLGEMVVYYGCADVALLGGSFAPLGGQNLIEAAACGCPVVMGPHTFNFGEASRLAEEVGAALRVADLQEGVAAALDLVFSPRRNEWVQNALAFAHQHRGAARMMALRVLQQQRALPAPSRRTASAG